MLNKNELNTGDILLFKENNDFGNCYNAVFSCVTSCIEKITKSKYSHCAMIIRDPDFENFSKKGLFIFQSSFEAFPDAEDNKYKFGVELEEFDKVVDTAKDHEIIYVRRLICDRNPEFFTILNKIHKETYNKQYDFMPQDLIEAVTQNKTNYDYQSRNRFICSALLAFSYVQWGFLPKDTKWTIATPKMFGTDSNNPHKFIFSNKCHILKEDQLDI
jgi:hypothetical protein